MKGENIILRHDGGGKHPKEITYVSDVEGELVESKGGILYRVTPKFESVDLLSRN